MSHETSQETGTAVTPIDGPVYDLELLESLVGPVARREFEGAPDYAKSELYEWCIKLRLLDDRNLYHVAKHSIYESALVNRFHFNFEHIHCRATACYHEAERRLKLEDHDEECRPSGIYGRAHHDTMIDCHLDPIREVHTCTCGAAERYRERRGETPSDAD